MQLKKGQQRVLGNRQGLGIYVKDALENDVGNVAPPLRTLHNNVRKAINYLRGLCYVKLFMCQPEAKHFHRKLFSKKEQKHSRDLNHKWKHFLTV